jgi:hypothetical protein
VIRFLTRWLGDLPPVVFVTCVVGTATTAVDSASSHRTAAWVCISLAAYAVVRWTADRASSTRRVLVVAIAFGGAVLSMYLITQFRSLSVEGKVALLDGVGRALSAPFPHLRGWAPLANSAATLLEGPLLLAAGAAIEANSARWRAALTCATAVIGVAVMLTMSRGAWAGVAAGTAFWVAIRVAPRRRRAMAAAIGMAAALGISLLPIWAFGVNVFEAVGAALGGAFIRPDRLEIYRNSLTLLNDTGIGGLGPGEQFAVPYSRFALILQVPFVTYPHQLGLHIWLAYGLLGITAWVWWMGSVVAIVADSARSSPPPSFWGAAAGIVATLIHGATDARQAADPWTWVPVFLLVGYLQAFRGAFTGSPRSVYWMPALLAMVFGAGGLMRLAPIGAAVHTRAGLLQEVRGISGLAGDATEAESEYHRALAFNPHHAGAHRRLAFIAADRGEFEAAFKHASIALEEDKQALASRKTAGLMATWAGHVEMGGEILRTVPGAGQELETWAGWWLSRRENDAARNSEQVAAMLRRRAP